MNPADQRFADLASRALDGELSGADEAALAHLLAEDPERRDAFLDLDLLGRRLSAVVRPAVAGRRLAERVLAGLDGGRDDPAAARPRTTSVAAATPSSASSGPSRGRSAMPRTWPRRTAIISAAALALLTWLWWAVVGQRSASAVIVTNLGPTPIIGRDEQGAMRPIREGAELRPGELIAATATAAAMSATVVGEATIALAGRFELRLARSGQRQRFELVAGTLSASVSPHSAERPLIIATRFGDIVVVGTRFSVAVDGHGTLVAVEHGRVRLVPPDGNEGAGIAVAAGESALAAADGTIALRPPLAGGEGPELVFRNGAAGYAGTDDATISTQYLDSTSGNGVTSRRGDLVLVRIPEYETRALLRFGGLHAPAQARVTAAKLVLTCNNWDAQQSLRGVYLRSPWNLAAQGNRGLGWRNRDRDTPWSLPGADAKGPDAIPGRDFVIAKISGSGDSVRAAALDPQIVQSWIDDPATNQGVVFALDAPGVVRIHAGDDSERDRRPLLVINYRLSAAAAQPPAGDPR